jgi:hypothetical protein
LLRNKRIEAAVIAVLLLPSTNGRFLIIECMSAAALENKSVVALGFANAE